MKNYMICLFLFFAIFFAGSGSSILLADEIGGPPHPDDTRMKTQPRALQQDGDVTIDVIILYTQDAADWAMSDGSEIEAMIDQSITETNIVYKMSNTGVTFKLRYKAKLADFSESGDVAKFAYPEYFKAFNGSQTIRDLREQYGADLVQVIVRKVTDPKKFLSVWGAADIQGQDWVSVARVDKMLAPTFTVAHEFGHLIGYNANQTITNMHQTGVLAIEDPKRYTIMAKDLYDPESTERVARFSEYNADLIKKGAPSVAEKMNTACYTSESLFCDVHPDRWSHDAIVELYNHGITNGCDSEGKPNLNLPFCPDERVDRAHLAVFLVRRLHYTEPGYEPPGPYQGHFPDVPSDHAQALWIEELFEAGITIGANSCNSPDRTVSGGGDPGDSLKFCPDDIVRREQMASLLMRTEEVLKKIPDPESFELDYVFDDVDHNNVHIAAIEYMYKRGFTEGCASLEEEKDFCPLDAVDRETMAVFMARTYGYITPEPPDEYEPNDYTIKGTMVDNNRSSRLLNAEVRVADTQTHSISPASDIDWLWFELNGPSAITLLTSGSRGDTRMRLYDSGLNLIEFNDDYDSGSVDNFFSKIDRQCGEETMPAGRYYVRVDEFGYNNVIPEYQISLTVDSQCAVDNSPKIYLPAVRGGSGGSTTPSVASGIYGRVTYKGNPVSGLNLLLRHRNGSSWSTTATASTDSNGGYYFSNPPSLTSGQVYYVRYSNNAADNPNESDYVWSWLSFYITDYSTGDFVSGGDFDVANIELQSHATSVKLPYTFQWGSRSTKTSSSYNFRLFDPSNGDTFWQSNSLLGSVSSFILAELPAGFEYSTDYGWDVSVRSPDGGYGSSYFYRSVRFTEADPPPAAPSNFAVVALDRDSIQLTWQDNANNETGFSIWKKTASGAEEIARVAANTTSYAVNDLQSNTEYCFYMRAYHATGTSSWTGTTCARTPFYFYDDFSDSNSGWPSVTFSSYRARYVSSKYELTIYGNNLEMGHVNSQNATLPSHITDYTIEAKMNLYSGGPARYGFIFDFVDGQNYYIFTVNPDSQHWQLDRIKNGSRSTRDEGTDSAINKGGSTNDVKVQVSGGRIYMYVNDERVDSQTGGDFSGSRSIGLIAKAGTGTAAVRFDNFRLQED